MKKSKKMLLMLLIVVVLVLLTVIIKVVQNKKESATEEVSEGTLMLDFTDSSVTQFGWSGDETCSFTKTETGWVYDEDSAFPVDVAKIDLYLSNLNAVYSSKTITTNAALSEYGLDEPEYSFWAVVDGEKMTVTFGDQAALSSGVYCNTEDGFVYIVSTDFRDELCSELWNFLEYETLVQLSDICEIDFNGLVLSFEDDNWYASVNENKILLDNDSVQDLLDEISDFELDDCLVYNDSEQNYTAEFTFTVKDSDNSLTLLLGSDDQSCFVRLPGSDMVYEVSSGVYNTITAFDYSEYRPQEVVTVDKTDVATFVFTVESKIYCLPADDLSLAVVDKINSLKVSSYVETEQPKSLELGVKVNLDSQTIDLNFYRYDSSLCLVELNGQYTVLVDRDSVVELRENVFDLIW